VCNVRVQAGVPRARNDASSVTIDEDALRAALREAHISGGVELIRSEIPPLADFLGDPQGGIRDAHQAEIRERTFDLLRRQRDPRLPDPPDEALVHEMMNFIIAKPVGVDYAVFLEAELAMNGEDPYPLPGPADLPDSVHAGFRVAMIGARMFARLAGIRVKAAGFPFVIFEGNSNVEGTRHQNAYPDRWVGSPNHTYLYSFRRNASPP